MNQAQPEQPPAMTVNVPMFLRILTIVKESYKAQPDVLEKIVQNEIYHLIAMIENDVLTPKWTGIVHKEVADLIEKSVQERLKHKSGGDLESVN